MHWYWQWQEIVFVVFTLIWWSEFVFFPSNKQGRQDRKSFLLVLGAVFVALGCGIAFSLFDVGVPPQSALYKIRIAALAVYGMGHLLRITSLRTLGKSFSREVQAVTKMELVSDGPYRWFRHPLYIALFMQVAGAAAFMGSLPGLISAALLMIAVLSVRIKNEERFLLQELGDRYRQWAGQRLRIFPGIKL